MVKLKARYSRVWKWQGIGHFLPGFSLLTFIRWTFNPGLFDSYLEKHAYNFMALTASDKLKEYNKLTASEIVERFMRANTNDFLKRNF